MSIHIVLDTRFYTFNKILYKVHDQMFKIGAIVIGSRIPCERAGSLVREQDPL